MALLRCIRSWEGGYGSNTGNGYYGAYQANRDFWIGYGGDPRYLDLPGDFKAPKWMQDEVATRGYRARGLQPWSVNVRNYCSRTPPVPKP